MVLVDTSVWVSHLRTGDPTLKKLLHDTQVMCHDFIIGELACGQLKNRKEVLSLLESLPRTSLVTQEEILRFIEAHTLAGTGIGFIDAHLLSSALLSGVPLWTLDNSLRGAAYKLGIVYEE